jgi:hypothetical protein
VNSYATCKTHSKGLITPSCFHHPQMHTLGLFVNMGFYSLPAAYGRHDTIRTASVSPPAPAGLGWDPRADTEPHKQSGNSRVASLLQRPPRAMAGQGPAPGWPQLDCALQVTKTARVKALSTQ